VTHFLDESCLDELLMTLSGCPGPAAGTSDLTLCEGFIELRFRPLDGRAVRRSDRRWRPVGRHRPEQVQRTGTGPRDA